jgi:acetate---CoA ligase (ADP-forming)
MVVMLSAPEVAQRMAQGGVVVIADPSRAMRALGAAWAMRQRRGALHRVELRDAAAVADTPPIGPCATEADAKARLLEAGLPVPTEYACADREAAVRAASALGCPVVAKILSADIPHKTEVGGVILNLADDDAVAAAFDELMRRAAQHRPAARLDGVLIAPMVSGGIETIAGVVVDPVFGPIVMFGLGGIATELFRDVAFASAPLTPTRAGQLIDGTRASRLLQGWRGAPPADREALVDALVKLSLFAAAHSHELAAIDINPLVARQHGCACLDAVIALRPANHP